MNQFAEDVPKAAAFIEEILAVCRKHGLSIAHEDSQGAFIVELYSNIAAQWLSDALVDEGVDS